MAVLVYIESENNQFKKSSYEALCYGKALGDNIGEAVYGIVVNCTDTESLNVYGADKIININSPDLSALTIVSLLQIFPLAVFTM